METLFTVFQVDGVDDGFTLEFGQRELDYCRISGVDHDGSFDFLGHQVQERGYVCNLVPVRVLKADVQDVGAVSHLTATNLSSLFK